jgi:hypothetical protein
VSFLAHLRVDEQVVGIGKVSQAVDQPLADCLLP